MKTTRSALGDEPHPRAAMTISLITGETLDTTLYHLAQLEADGQVCSVTDEAGVKRWTLMDLEQGPAMELGAQIMLDRHRFDLTPHQVRQLGL